MAAINIYLTFDGQTEEAINFYKSVFGGEFVNFQRFKDMPSDKKMSDAEANRVMHVTLPIGDGTVLMASDTMEGHPYSVGNNFSISVSADSEQEADKIFNALAKGGKTTMPMDKMFWGAYFGMCTDKFGIQWMVNHDYPHQ